MWRWRENVIRRAGGRCECGCGRPADDAHHVFPKDARHWPALALDPANGVAVARYCHAMHHAAMRRLPRAAVARAEPLAIDDRMRAYIDRTYAGRPVRVAATSNRPI